MRLENLKTTFESETQNFRSSITREIEGISAAIEGMVLPLCKCGTAVLTLSTDSTQRRLKDQQKLLETLERHLSSTAMDK